MEISYYVDLSNKVILYQAADAGKPWDRLAHPPWHWLVRPPCQCAAGGFICYIAVEVVRALFQEGGPTWPAFLGSLILPFVVLGLGIFGVSYSLSGIYDMICVIQNKYIGASQFYIVEEGFICLVHTKWYDFTGKWYMIDYNEMALVRIRESMSRFWTLGIGIDRTQERTLVKMKATISSVDLPQVISLLENKNVKVERLHR